MEQCRKAVGDLSSNDARSLEKQKILDAFQQKIAELKKRHSSSVADSLERKKWILQMMNIVPATEKVKLNQVLKVEMEIENANATSAELFQQIESLITGRLN